MDFLLDSDPSRDKMIEYIKRLPLDKRRYVAKILPVRKKRSSAENNYQWLVFEMIAKEFGSTKEEIHDFFCDKFLRVTEVIQGHSYERVKGTSGLSTTEHSTFMESVRMWCAVEEGIIIPLPGEIIVDNLTFDS